MYVKILRNKSKSEKNTSLGMILRTTLVNISNNQFILRISVSEVEEVQNGHNFFFFQLNRIE